jgi:hypothetical protein
MSFESEPRERTNRVSQLTNEVGSIYRLPQYIIQRGQSTRAFEVTSSDELKYRIYEGYRNWIKALSLDPESERNLLSDIAADFEERGITAAFLMDAQGRRLIYFLDDNDLDHEVKHAMAARSSVDSGAFMTFGNDPRHLYLEEAINDLVGLGVKYPQKATDDLLEWLDGPQKRIPHHMVYFVRKLLEAMKLTEHGDKPFTLQDLANHYFGVIDIPREQRVDFLVQDLARRTDAGLRPYQKSLLVSVISPVALPGSDD